MEVTVIMNSLLRLSRPVLVQLPRSLPTLARVTNRSCASRVQSSSLHNGRCFSTQDAACPRLRAMVATSVGTSTPVTSSNVMTRALTPSAVQRRADNVNPTSSAVFTVALPDSVRDELTSRLLTETRSPYAHYEELTETMKGILKDILPRDIQEVVAAMGCTHEPNALLIKNCPVKKNPGPTAEVDRHCPEDGFLEEFFLLGVAGMRNCKPHLSPHKKSGEIFTQIRAIKGAEKKASSQGNGVFFPLHVEEVNRTHGLDFLSLLCKKGDPNAATTVLPVHKIIRGLPNWVLEGMQKPEFAMNPGELWTGPKTPMIAPILQSDPRGGFYIRYNAGKDRVEGLTPEAQKVVQYLKEHFEKGLEFDQVFLERGDCLTVSNLKAMHGRTAYTPSKPWDQRRDLVRLYETSELESLFEKMHL